MVVDHSLDLRTRIWRRSDEVSNDIVRGRVQIFVRDDLRDKAYGERLMGVE
jgi:hypothetical protein